LFLFSLPNSETLSLFTPFFVQEFQDVNKDGTITKDEYVAWFCDEEQKSKLKGNQFPPNPNQIVD
jgi:hypothetical protein